MYTVQLVQVCGHVHLPAVAGSCWLAVACWLWQAALLASASWKVHCQWHLFERGALGRRTVTADWHGGLARRTGTADWHARRLLLGYCIIGWRGGRQGGARAAASNAQQAPGVMPGQWQHRVKR